MEKGTNLRVHSDSKNNIENDDLHKQCAIRIVVVIATTLVQFNCMVVFSIREIAPHGVHTMCTHCCTVQVLN